MKKTTRLLAFCLNFYSISAVADYHCGLKLQSIDDSKLVVEKSYSIGRSQIRAGSLGEIHVEDKRRSKKITLELNAVMSGWAGEEDAAFVIMRRESTKRSTRAQAHSDVIKVKGDDVGFGTTFDLKYDVEVKCRVEEPTSR